MIVSQARQVRLSVAKSNIQGLELLGFIAFSPIYHA